MTDGGEQWISASVARGMGPSGTNFIDSIIDRAKVGLVKTRARLLVWNRNGEEEKQSNCDIPEDFWRYGAVSENWDQGDFEVFWNRSETSWMAGPDATDSYAYGVSFAKADIEGMLPTGNAAVIRQQGYISKRGRWPVVDWEAVMIELARALFVGDLQPKGQADIERAIADYLMDGDKMPSESTIREHARPLWRAIAGEAEK